MKELLSSIVFLRVPSRRMNLAILKRSIMLFGVALTQGIFSVIKKNASKMINPYCTKFSIGLDLGPIVTNQPP